MMFNPKTKLGFIIFANADVKLKQVKALLMAKADDKTPYPARACPKHS